MGLKLMAELGLDGAGFHAGLKKAEGAAHGVIEGLKGFVVGAVGIYTVEQAISKTVETAKELVNTSQRLGVAPEQLQVLRHAAEESGTELENVVKGFEKIDIARQKAFQPGAEGRAMAGAFKALGIDSAALHSQTAAQLFMGPLAGAARNRSPEEVGPVLREILGKGFGELMPVLKTDFAELDKKMKESGAIMSAETAVKLKALADQFGLLTQIITSQLGPALLKMAEWIYGTVLKVGKTSAGASAFYGAGTAGKGVLGTAGALLKTAGLGAEHLVGAISTDELKRRLGQTINLPAARGAVPGAEAPWQKKLEEFQATMAKAAEEAKRLRNPVPPDFNTAVLPAKIPQKALEPVSDSLTKVGNFLGGMGVANRIEEEKLKLLRQIAQNTIQRSFKNMDQLTHPVHGGLTGGFLDVVFPHFGG